MQKIIISLALAASISIVAASSALALLPNHDYSVQMSTLSDGNQQTIIEEISAITDTDGKLSFRFSNVPDTSVAPFLLVEIIDMTDGQPQVVRQNLVPSPEVGQAIRVGMNEISHRQTQASLRAFSDAGQAEPLRAMFPLTMIPGGALSGDDTDSLGMMADFASVAFDMYMNQAGIDAEQMANFRSGLAAALRDFSANCMLAVDEIDPTSATNLYGRANGLFMQAIITAATDAGIDPGLIPGAFDQARLEMENSQGSMGLLVPGFAMFDGSYMASRLQIGMQSQMQEYMNSMAIFPLDIAQTQAFLDAKAVLNEAILQARQDYQQIFADSINPPDQTIIDQAQADFSIALQAAMDNFMLATEASDLQVGTMLGQMAEHMSGGMMGGGMMTGPGLGSMGFGLVRTMPGGTQLNWSMMMIAGSTLADTMPDMDYTSITGVLMLELGQMLIADDLPVIPDWAALPDDASRSLLQFQFDLMLTSMIEHQGRVNLSGMMNSLDQAEIGVRYMANRQTIHEGLLGLTDAQRDALVASMSLMHSL